MITDFQYLQDLVLRRKLKGEGALFHVDQLYTVAFRLNGNPVTVTVPVDFDTDLASIPAIVPRFVAQQVDAGLEAAVVHDWLYWSREFPRDVADGVFLAALLAAGVPAWRARVMYAAVRLAGGAYFQVEEEGRPPLPPTAHAA